MLPSPSFFLCFCVFSTSVAAQENIRNYCQACKTFGVPAGLIFSPPQLSQGSGMPLVIKNLLCVRELLETGTITAEAPSPRSSGTGAEASSITASSSIASSEGKPKEQAGSTSPSTGKLTTSLRVVPPPTPGGSAVASPASRSSTPTPTQTQSQTQTPTPTAKADVTTFEQDMKIKEELKYSTALEDSVKEWIRGVMDDATLFTEKGVSFLAALKSGVVLCELVNRLQPGTIAKIVRSKFEYQQIDNIVCFRWACEKLGLQETIIFSTSDLFEGRNGGRVLDTLVALARFAVANGLTRVALREPTEANSLYMQSLTDAGFVCPTDAETARTPCEPAQRPLLEWANGHLRRAVPPVVLHNFTTDVKTGLKLLTLAECLLREPCRDARYDPPAHLLECLHNADVLFAFLRQRKTQDITCCKPKDVVNGDGEHVAALVSYMREECDYDFAFNALVNQDGEEEVTTEEIAEFTKMTARCAVQHHSPKSGRASASASSASATSASASTDSDGESSGADSGCASDTSVQGDGSSTASSPDRTRRHRKGSKKDRAHHHHRHHKHAVAGADGSKAQQCSRSKTSALSHSSTTFNDDDDDDNNASETATTNDNGGGEENAGSERGGPSGETAVQEEEEEEEETEAEAAEAAKKEEVRSLSRTMTMSTLKVQRLMRAQAQMRKRVATELFTTEESYCTSMDTMCEKVVRPLLELARSSSSSSSSTSESSAQKPLTEDEVAAIFRNAFQLRDDHAAFLERLRARFAAWSDETTTLGDLFLAQLPVFEHYRAYLAGYAASACALHYLTQHNLPTKTLVEHFEIEQYAINKLNVPSFLVMPVQRLPRYVLLLSDLKKYTPPGHPDGAFLEELLPRLQRTIADLNSTIDPQREANMAANVAIAERIAGDDADAVVRGEKTLWLEGAVKQVASSASRKKLARKGHCFLFDTAIVVCALTGKKDVPYALLHVVDAATPVNPLFIDAECKIILTCDTGLGFAAPLFESEPASPDLRAAAALGTAHTEHLSRSTESLPDSQETTSTSTSSITASSNEGVLGSSVFALGVGQQVSSASFIVSSRSPLPHRGKRTSQKMDDAMVGRKTITLRFSSKTYAEWRSRLQEWIERARHQNDVDTKQSPAASPSLAGP